VNSSGQVEGEEMCFFSLCVMQILSLFLGESLLVEDDATFMKD
jgi:hypothetical protein